ncbi:MAG: hypothetical protein K1X65_07505 [Caldilineales bacterium]|nr:hypothetical protein [Caldilineales bacterium]MCW5859827.1 hypothetical protein [Caldilineales bacterium]
MAGETPNLYELGNTTVQITYTPAGLAGLPRLTYKDKKQNLVFQGAEIRSSPSDLGVQITVGIETVFDFKDVLLTVLIPRVRLSEGASEEAIQSVAIETTLRSSIGGPGLLTGQIQTYRALNLKGMARLVDF